MIILSGKSCRFVYLAIHALSVHSTAYPEMSYAPDQRPELRRAAASSTRSSAIS